MTRAVQRTAAAKLNLYLHVVGRRDNGYHELDSLVAFLDVGDRLEVSPAPAVTLEVMGPLAAGVPTGDDNLVLRAARLLAETYGVQAGARIVLEKHLPAAAGLGGGSADAAAALLALVELWQLPLEPDRLAAIGLKIGADVPVCLQGRPTRMQGIGERLAPAPDLPPCGVVLLNPGVPLVTRDVFVARTGAFSKSADLPPTFADPASLFACLGPCRNDLEVPARTLAPVVGEVLGVLQGLPGARLARMAGSGATCFALFDDAATAAATAADLKLPCGWWCAATAISCAP